MKCVLVNFIFLEIFCFEGKLFFVVENCLLDSFD